MTRHVQGQRFNFEQIIQNAAHAEVELVYSAQFIVPVKVEMVGLYRWFPGTMQPHSPGKNSVGNGKSEHSLRQLWAKKAQKDKGGMLKTRSMSHPK